MRVAVAEALGQFGNPEEGESRLLEAWKPLPSNDYTRCDCGCWSVCVIVKYKVGHVLYVKESNKSGDQSKTRL
jgi:hypothetical protein